MARITGLLYILPVRDLEQAVRFYSEAFAVAELFRNETIAFVGDAGSEWAIGLRLDPDHAGSGPQNVGLHLDHAIALDAAVADINAAGGRIVEQGMRGSGIPFARFADPDGNVLEL
jgi:predicted enzyme related to lactoylglutathione lyase